MNIQAIAKNVRISPRKVRLVADAIRNLTITDAAFVLEAADQQAARPLGKALKSAVANAVNNAKLDQAHLVIGSIQINDGQSFKRFRPSTRGRIHPYKKRGSTIKIVLTEKLSVAKALDSKVVTKKVEKIDKGGKK